MYIVPCMVLSYTWVNKWSWSLISYCAKYTYHRAADITIWNFSMKFCLSPSLVSLALNSNKALRCMWVFQFNYSPLSIISNNCFKSMLSIYILLSRVGISLCGNFFHILEERCSLFHIGWLYFWPHKLIPTLVRTLIEFKGVN